jgi:hypothetical protein
MRMRTYSAILLCGFVLGVLLYPAWHRGHVCVAPPVAAPDTCASAGCEHGDPVPVHDPDRCLVCLLIAAGLVPPVAVALARAVPLPAAEGIGLPVPSPAQRLACRLPFSCGPPPAC